MAGHDSELGTGIGHSSVVREPDSGSKSRAAGEFSLQGQMSDSYLGVCLSYDMVNK